MRPQLRKIPIQLIQLLLGQAQPTVDIFITLDSFRYSGVYPPKDNMINFDWSQIHQIASIPMIITRSRLADQNAIFHAANFCIPLPAMMEIRLYIDGNLVINDWVDQALTTNNTVLTYPKVIILFKKWSFTKMPNWFNCEFKYGYALIQPVLHTPLTYSILCYPYSTTPQSSPKVPPGTQKKLELDLAALLFQST